DPKLALEKAKAFETETGKDIVFPIMDLYSKHGGDAHILFFQNNIKYMTGFEIASFCGLYAKTAKRCTSSVNALVAARDFEMLSKGANRFTKYGAVKGVRDIALVWEAKEKTAKAELEAAKGKNENTTAIETKLKEVSETKDILNKIYNDIK
ncbi:MAG: hypothetical protein K0S32_4537, partial [Bacteroidetes bacterium]|nr:hypothetical protein [Bacteroidota bacterium]